jgi:DNA-binding MarR family transcriptional regulator
MEEQGVNDHGNILDEAERFSVLFRSLMRQLTLGLDGPAAEMPLGQLRVCNILCDGPRSMSSLGRELGVSQSAITQLADRLERAGLVKRGADDGDRRVRTLQLTPHGLAIMQSHEEARRGRMAATLDNLTLKARNEAVASLESLIRAATAANAQAAVEGDTASDDNGNERNNHSPAHSPHFHTSKASL